MRKRGYSDALATGPIAAGGTLGSIIPPSGALIVFGILAEQSIGKLFTAAIIPGLSQALCYIITIVLLCVGGVRSIGPATARVPWSERRAAPATHPGHGCAAGAGGDRRHCVGLDSRRPRQRRSGATGALLILRARRRRKLNRRIRCGGAGANPCARPA